MKKFAKYITHYASLLGILLAAVVGMALFNHKPEVQAGIAIAMALSYVTWGIIHHILEKDLYITVVLEYFTIALVGLLLVLSLIYWS